MGIRATVKEITKTQLAMFLDGEDIPTDQLSAQTNYPLEKSWRLLHDVFSKQAPPLDKMIQGDLSHPAYPDSLANFIGGERAFHFGLYSRQCVRDIADALGKLTADQLQDMFEREGVHFDQYVGDYYSALYNSFYSASVHGNALYIVIS